MLLLVGKELYIKKEHIGFHSECGCICRRDRNLSGYYSRRHAHRHSIGGHVLQYHTTGPNVRPVAHRDGTQQSRPRAEQHTVANLWVTDDVFDTCSAKGHLVKHRYVVADTCSGPDHHACAMIDQKACAKCCPRMYVDMEDSIGSAVQK